MVTLEQVKHWGIGQYNIGHAIKSSQNGWCMTLCGDWTPSLVIQKDTPGRICSVCRKRLKDATVSEDAK